MPAEKSFQYSKIYQKKPTVQATIRSVKITIRNIRRIFREKTS
jgi:hypothetical protein